MLPDWHLSFLVSQVIDTLDLTAIYEPYLGKSRRGQPPYDPRMMVKLLVYAYTVGIPSSRRIELKTYEDLPFRILTCDQHPDHDTISGFRKQHLKALSQLFVQVLAICEEAKLTKLGHVALDGAKVKANASKHKAMSYGRMGEKEAELEAEVQELIRQAEQEDDKEDTRYGKGKRGDEVPDELSFKQGRLETIRKAKLRTPEGKATYSKRKETVEPVFGQMKLGRGLRQFLLRGLAQVRGEWRLWCLGHNILKLWRSGWQPQLARG